MHTDIWALPKKQRALLLPHSCVCWVSHEKREYSVSPATAAASARSECCYGLCASQERGLCCVRLCCGCCFVLCQPGENKCVCSSYLSSGLLPAFYFVLCLPWVQPTVQTVNSKTIGTVSSISNTVAIPVSRASSQTRDQTHVSYISHIGRQITVWATREEQSRVLNKWWL